MRPYTIVSCAVSLDGYLDDATPTRLVLSGPQDLDEVDELRARADAILVGAGTIRADDPRLLVRDPARAAARAAAGRPAQPLRVTLTAAGGLDPAARFFTGPGTPLVYCAAGTVAVTRKTLGDKAEVVHLGEARPADRAAAGAGPQPSLPAVLHDLAAHRGVASLLVEGGSLVLRDLLAADLADELRLAVAPFFVGDPRAPRFALPARYPHGPADPLTLLSLRQVGNVAVHHYRFGQS